MHLESGARTRVVKTATEYQSLGLYHISVGSFENVYRNESCTKVKGEALQLWVYA